MRRIAAVAIATLTLVGLVGTSVGTAGASTSSAKTTRFCKVLRSFDADDLGNPTSRDEAEKTVKKLKKLERAAKGDNKEALGTIVDAYEGYADGDSAKKAFANGDFVRAVGTFAIEVAKCAVEQIPTSSVPQ